MIIMPSIEKNDRLLVWAETLFGKILLAGAIALMAAQWSRATALAFAVAAVAFTLAPKMKIQIILLSSVVLWLTGFDINSELISRILARGGSSLSRVEFKFWHMGFIALSFLIPLAVFRLRPTWIKNRLLIPIIVVAADVFILVAGELYSQNRQYYPFAIAAVTVFQFLWFIAYAIRDSRVFGRHFQAWHLSFAGGLSAISRYPFPKGAQHLAEIEADSQRQLARLQLKAIKLFIWTIGLSIIRRIIVFLMTGDLAQDSFFGQWISWVPTFNLPNILILPFDINQLLQGTYRWYHYWVFLLGTYAVYQMQVTIVGNIAVAMFRFFGFDLFRVAHNPMSSSSVADFFRRIHYYYYQFISIFFFQPVARRYFKSLTAKIVAASFFAIIFGSGLQHHFFGVTDVILLEGPWRALQIWAPAGFYHFLFAGLLAVSLLRERSSRNRPKPLLSRPLQAIRFASIYVTYCLVFSWIICWIPRWTKAPFSTNVVFFERLFGL